jgi:PKD repeat protein
VWVYTKPKASFTRTPVNGVAPLKVKVDASASSDEDGRLIAYKWTFGDGTSGTGRKTSHVYTKGGTKTIRLTVVDNDGWTHTVTRAVTVIEKPYPPVNLNVENIIINSLYVKDYVNILSWKNNPLNTGKIRVAKFRVYRKKTDEGGPKDFVFLKEFENWQFQFEDTNISSEEEMKNYTYAVTAVDYDGRESDMKKIKSFK